MDSSHEYPALVSSLNQGRNSERHQLIATRETRQIVDSGPDRTNMQQSPLIHGAGKSVH